MNDYALKLMEIKPGDYAVVGGFHVHQVGRGYAILDRHFGAPITLEAAVKCLERLGRVEK